MAGFSLAVLVAALSAAPVAVFGNRAADSPDEPEESSLLQRSPRTSRSNALLQEHTAPEGFSLVEDAFNFYDLDGDLKITVEDLQRVAGEEADNGDFLGEHGVDGFFTEATLQRMISEMDTDGSGCVTLEEFDKASVSATEKAGTEDDRKKTQKTMEALTNLSESLSLAERGNLSMLQKLQQVRRNAKAARQSKKEAAGILPWSRRRTPPVAKPEWTGEYGAVHQLYTFGAPSTADPPLRNGRIGSGRFEGLRIVNSDREPGTFWGYWIKTDPATWIVSVVGYEHPIMDVLVLKKYSQMEPEHQSSSSISDLHSFPSSDNPLWHFSLHYISAYGELANAQSHWPLIQRMGDFSGHVYSTEAALQEAAQRHGSRVVEFFRESEDTVGLIQDESTLDCTMVFSGSDNPGDWVNNVLILGADFCGFQDVHVGFVNEWMAIISSDYWQQNIRTKLPMCGKLYVTGHSLGGALASLFSACVNHGDVSADDHEANLVRWKPGTPVLMNTKGVLMSVKNVSST